MPNETAEKVGEVTSDWAGIMGRFTKRLENGLENFVLEPINVVGRTAFEDIRNVTEFTRGVLYDTLAPVMALDSDDGFWKKMGKSLLEIPRSVIWGNIKNVSLGVGKLAGTTLGVGIDEGEFKLRKGAGVMALGGKILNGIVGSEIDPMQQALEDDQESMLSTGNWGGPAETIA